MCSIVAIRREGRMVFHQFNLFPHLTVLDNQTLAPVLVRKPPRAAQAAVKRQAMALLQRVAIARALCMEPRILLFDEPTSALDPEMAREAAAGCSEQRAVRKEATATLSHWLVNNEFPLADRQWTRAWCWR